MDEVWRDIDTIKEADGICAYQVSNLGNVRRAKEVVSSVVAKDMGTTGWCGAYVRKLKPRVLKLNKTYSKKGKQRYVFVSIKDITYAVHRLVAAAFLEADYKPGLVVNHKDGNKHNNCVNNLEWVTPAENEHHSYDTLGKQVWNKGTKGLMPKQWKEDRRNKYVERNKSLIKDHKDGLTVGQLAEKYDICKRQVQQILKDNKDD